MEFPQWYIPSGQDHTAPRTQLIASIPSNGDDAANLPGTELKTLMRLSDPKAVKQAPKRSREVIASFLNSPPVHLPVKTVDSLDYQYGKVHRKPAT